VYIVKLGMDQSRDPVLLCIFQNRASEYSLSFQAIVML